jgi:hypothetical protein
MSVIALEEPNTEDWGNFTVSSLYENTERIDWENLSNDFAIHLLEQNIERIHSTYTFLVDKSLVDSDAECSICLCNLCDNDDELVSCPNCKNVFHAECQKAWLSRSEHKNCTLCRSTDWIRYNFQ